MPRAGSGRRHPAAVITTLLYSLLALDQTIAHLATQYGAWFYAILAAIIFAETGLVVFPFLPGDSLLFLAGTVIAAAGLNVHVLVAGAGARGGPRRLGQLLGRPLHRPEGLRAARFALVAQGAPARAPSASTTNTAA